MNTPGYLFYTWSYYFLFLVDFEDLPDVLAVDFFVDEELLTALVPVLVEEDLDGAIFFELAGLVDLTPVDLVRLLVAGFPTVVLLFALG